LSEGCASIIPPSVCSFWQKELVGIGKPRRLVSFDLPSCLPAPSFPIAFSPTQFLRLFPFSSLEFKFIFTFFMISRANIWIGLILHRVVNVLAGIQSQSIGHRNFLVLKDLHLPLLVKLGDVQIGLLNFVPQTDDGCMGAHFCSSENRIVNRVDSLPLLRLFIILLVYENVSGTRVNIYL
uniref:Uncharacterized protein n=1 Tax=Cucumis melo TaxID=3656 RepID=A0A9I9EF05_CUCME